MPPHSPKLTRLHAWECNIWWGLVEPLLAESLRRSNSDFTSGHIKRKLDHGEASLWIILDGSDLLAAGTTEFVRLENGRTLLMVGTLSGKDMALWDHTWEQFEEYARRKGCDGIQIVGRIGWVRYMKARGFKQPWVVLEKKL